VLGFKKRCLRARGPAHRHGDHGQKFEKSPWVIGMLFRFMSSMIPLIGCSLFLGISFCTVANDMLASE
jgi:hypothetical protein